MLECPTEYHSYITTYTCTYAQGTRGYTVYSDPSCSGPNLRWLQHNSHIWTVKGHLCRGDDLESHVHTVKKRKRRLSTRSHSTYKTHPTSLVIWQIDQSHRNIALDVQKNWSLSMQTMAYLSSFFSAYREDVQKKDVSTEVTTIWKTQQGDLSRAR